jgi:hypothetical protein
MADKSQLSLGQQVKVHHLRGVTKQDGTIVRIGCDLVDIRAGESRNTEAFRIGTQQRNGDSVGAQAYFRTLEQDAENQRRVAAVYVLNTASASTGRVSSRSSSWSGSPTS